MNIQDRFLALRQCDAAIAFIEMDGSRTEISYSALAAEAQKILGGLQGRGLAPGAPVVLQCAGVRSAVTVFWACVLGGYLPAILPLASDAASERAFEQIAALLENPWVITDRETAAGTAGSGEKRLPVRALGTGAPGTVVPRQDGDPGMLQFTSGTTSAPRGAVLTLANLLEGGIASSIVIRPGVAERYISWLPLSHCFGFVAGHLVPLVNGLPQLLIHPACFLRDPAIWLREASRFGATISGLPVFGAQRLLKTALPGDADLSAMNVCFVGGEDVDPRILRALEAHLAPAGWHPHTLLPAYGLSETTMGVAATPMNTPFQVDGFLNESLAVGDRVFFCEPDEGIPYRVSVGVLDACNDVEIRDEDGASLADGHLGHVFIRGTNVMRGYYPCPAGPRPGVGADGFFDTGDLGWFRRHLCTKAGETGGPRTERWLTIFGRCKHIIIHNGKNYLVTDLEQTAGAPGKPVILIQGSLPGSGEGRLVLFGTGSEAEVAAAARRMAAVWHILPDFGGVLPAIPQTPSGKADRLALAFALERGRFRDQLFSLAKAGGEAPAGDYKRMAELWAAVLEIPAASIAMDSHFVTDCGGDSLALANLAWRLEAGWQGTLSPADWQRDLTLGQMTDRVLEGREQP